MSQLFHKTFASGLTGATGFDSTTASNGTIAQSGGAGLNGTTGGVTCTRTANSPNIWGSITQDFTGKTFLRTAWYTNLSALTIGTDNHNTALFRFYNGGTIAALLLVKRVSGVLKLEHYLSNDAGSSVVNQIALGSPAWMELRIKRSSAAATADAVSQLFLGGGSYAALGELVSTHTGVIHYTRFEQNTVLLGMHAFATSTSVGGSILIDEWTMRDDDTPILAGRASVSVSVSGFGAVAASVQKVASAPVQLSGFGDLSLSVFKEALIPIAVSGWGDVGVTVLEEVIQLYGDILRPTREQLRVHGTQRETLRIAQPMQEKLWVSSL